MKKLALIAAACSVALYAGQVQADPPTPKFTPAQADGNIFVPPKPKKGFRYPDCFCTDSEGKRIELGQTTCLKIGSQLVLARCGMSVNNPTWRHISKGCPTA
ncbi:MAG: hypothetical protein AAF439_11665 [Pseudomonadota bacterium]